ncbi:MAG: ribosomal RNA small subunit methyltransferase A [Chloroflexi bacterium]|nr:ribosomal RNA small subunit methyltransferase A [Chloroflexota bacterium]
MSDVSVCEAMVRAAQVSSTDDVLEIGPGLGVLTSAIARRAGRVVAVELDRDLAVAVPLLVPSPNLTVVQGDALTFDPATEFSGSYKLLGNLPYAISTPLLARYLVEVRRPSRMVVMLQREVAERVVGAPGRTSYLSILVRLFGQAHIVRHVPPGAFVPRPRVTSSVIAMEIAPQPAIASQEIRPFLEFVRAGYAQPRKTLLNSLAQGLGLPKAALQPVLEDANVNPDLRPAHLDLETWLRLFQPFSSA